MSDPLLAGTGKNPGMHVDVDGSHGQQNRATGRKSATGKGEPVGEVGISLLETRGNTKMERLSGGAEQVGARASRCRERWQNGSMPLLLPAAVSSWARGGASNGVTHRAV